MTKQQRHKKILVIQGPNMNLLGHRYKNRKVTLEKLDLRRIRKKQISTIEELHLKF